MQSSNLEYLESHPIVVNVHIKCRNNYTKGRKFPDSAEQGSSDEIVRTKRLRSVSDVFKWDSDCFFCCKSVVVVL